MIVNSHNSCYNEEEKQQQVTLVLQMGFLEFFSPGITLQGPQKTKQTALDRTGT